MTEELCENCHKRPATINWLGRGSAMDYVHGIYQRWCERCAVTAQIQYAEEIIDNLPKLRKRLAEIDLDD